MKSHKSHLNEDKQSEVSDKRLLNIEATLNLIPYAGGFLCRKEKPSRRLARKNYQRKI